MGMETSTLTPPQEKTRADNHYCSNCKQTTKHSNMVCDRCGKTKEKKIGSLYRKPAFEEKLHQALTEEKPVLPKPEGEQKKTKAGAHRFDDGVKFTQMRVDDQFKTKEDPNTLR